MRIAVLSDVHGNLPALDAVLAEVEDEGFDLVVSGGDVVAGPMPRECLERLAGLGERVRWVMGNADREVMAAFDGTLAEDPADPAARDAQFAAARLDRGHRDLLASFAPTVVAGDALVCHGTPASDTGILTPRSSPERVAAALEGVDAPVAVGGHVHLQFLQRAGTTLWCNAGSVGLPYEGDGDARWLWIEDGEPELRRTAYDSAGAGVRMRDACAVMADSVAASLVEPVEAIVVTRMFEERAE
jgi:putative phosphoesterase